MKKTERAIKQIKVYKESESRILKHLASRKKREPGSIIADVIRDLLDIAEGRK